MHGPQIDVFHPEVFLANRGTGKRTVRLKSKRILFAQGTEASCVYYLQSGRARVTVVSGNGKEATIGLLGPGDFVGEESISVVHGTRSATVTTITGCTFLEIERECMIRGLREEHAFSDFFLNFLLSRTMRMQADLIDQLFNTCERRLARILLLMAEYDKGGHPQPLIPRITQETLAEMIGTTRSRVSFFMNRFRAQGFIEYSGRIRVHKSLLNVILNDHTSENPIAAEAKSRKRVDRVSRR